MKKLIFVFTLLVSTYVVHPSLSLAVPVPHIDVETLDVPSSIIPPVLGAEWTVSSFLNILETPDPHTTPVGGTFKFKSINIFTATADDDLFTPLFVPGEPVGFATPGPSANLADQGVYKVDLTLTGPGEFYYSDLWTVRIEDNRKFGSIGFTFRVDYAPEIQTPWGGGSLGGFGLDVNYTPPDAGATLFETNALPQSFEILLSPTADWGGQGFFASGGRIVIEGVAKDTALGTSRLLYDNEHWATGEGWLVDDFTRALGAGFVRTEVFDENTSIPEPATMVLLGLGGLVLLRRRRG